MSTKQRVKQLIDAGARPALDKANKSHLILRSGRTFTRLSKDDGDPTKAGLFWQSLTGQSLPDSGFMSQTAVREGNVEHIKLRDNKKGITRRLNLENGEWIFTKLGLKIYKKLRRNYIVNVPVTVHGTPAEGRSYSNNESPISKTIRHHCPGACTRTQHEPAIK